MANEINHFFRVYRSQPCREKNRKRISYLTKWEGLEVVPRAKENILQATSKDHRQLVSTAFNLILHTVRKALQMSFAYLT